MNSRSAADAVEGPAHGSRQYQTNTNTSGAHRASRRP